MTAVSVRQGSACGFPFQQSATRPAARRATAADRHDL